MSKSKFHYVCYLFIASLVLLGAWPDAKVCAEETRTVQSLGFGKNVKVTETETHFIIESTGIPDHETGDFPNRDNPNRILKQDYRFRIPKTPKKAEKTTKLPMGPIGVAVNGVPFYNPYNREGNDAVDGPFAEVFDSCCGHPDQLGRYHYHQYPTCLKSPFEDPEEEHSPLIGYAFDGFPIYGPNDVDGKPPTDLDECNGHFDEQRGYHYHVTEKLPYILGAYRGEVDLENFDRRGRFAGGRGGDGERRLPPPRRGPPPPRR